MWGDSGRKLVVKSLRDLLHTFTPPSAFSLCQLFQEPKKTPGLSTEKQQEGTWKGPRRSRHALLPVGSCPLIHFVIFRSDFKSWQTTLP